MKTLIYVLLTGVAVLSLPGCGTTQETKKSEKTGPAPLSIDARIAESAEMVSKSMRELSAIEIAAAGKLPSTTNKAPAGLGKKLNVKWNGPIGQFMSEAAKVSDGYSLVVRGKEPAIPVIINMDKKATTIFEVIKDAAIQSGVRANIVIDAANKLLILEYAV